MSSANRCQNPTNGEAPSPDTSDRDADRLRIVRYLDDSTDGVPFPHLVGEVFGKKGVIEPDADYKFAQRFVDALESRGLVEITRLDGVTWVRRRDLARPLEPQLALGKTPVGDGDDAKPSFECEETTDSDGNRYAKDRVRDYFEGTTRVFSDGIRSWLLEELSTELRSIDDRYNVFREREPYTGEEPDTLAVPYRTRFNTPSRAVDTLEGFEDALSRASDGYDAGTFLTLTVDPKRFEGHTDAVEALYDGKSRLMSWLSTDSRLGYTPVNLTVLEFMGNGLPHLHVCMFGVTASELPSHGELTAYWDERRDVGEQVHVGDIRRRERNDAWLLRSVLEGDDADISLADYLTDAMYDLVTVANTDADNLADRADAGDVSLWKQALYWYTERRYWSGSDALTRGEDADDGEDALPYVSRWEYVGTFHADDIPARVLRDLVSRSTSPDDGEEDAPPPD